MIRLAVISTNGVIAADYPVGRQSVSKICRRVQWPHVMDEA